MNNFKALFKQHSLLFLYSIVFFILLIGVIDTSGGTYMLEMFLFYIPFVAVYFLLHQVFKKDGLNKIVDRLGKLSNVLPSKSYLGLVGISFIFIIAHLIYLKGSPALYAIAETTTEGVTSVRQGISENSSAIWGYLSSFTLKGFLPFSILLLFYKKQNKLGIALLVLAAFYAFSLMQKSYILIVLMPLIIFAISKRKIGLFIGTTFTAMAIVVGLVVISNPQLRGYPQVQENLEVEVEEDDRPFIVRVAIGLTHRVFIVPGEMVSEWFEHIPQDKPFLNGQGYSFYTKITGQKHINYAKDLYPIIRPNYAERGLSGSVNAASFVYEYSNFGRIGLVISGIALAILLLIIEMIYKESYTVKISLNLFPVFMLSSGAITTLLFSGGWGLITVLFLLFNNEFSDEKN